ncbi:hypothetical protein U91I_00868 [alpha proteobacterium U9-1i]|nr:hypothetical protein U91I_00868 [alpha proteobacterium U9-1i]
MDPRSGILKRTSQHSRSINGPGHRPHSSDPKCPWFMWCIPLGTQAAPSPYPHSMQGNSGRRGGSPP